MYSVAVESEFVSKCQNEKPKRKQIKQHNRVNNSSTIRKSIKVLEVNNTTIMITNNRE